MFSLCIPFLRSIIVFCSYFLLPYVCLIFQCLLIFALCKQMCMYGANVNANVQCKYKCAFCC